LSNYKSSFFILLLLSLLSCDKKSGDLAGAVEDQTEQKPVARVGNKYLYPEDLIGITASGLSKKDSVEIIDRYINTWIKKQLLLSHVESSESFDAQAIEEKVREYRQTLMAYEFQKQYVESKLDSVVTEEEIKKYYQDHLQNFELKKNIVKGIYLKIPSNAPKLDKVSGLIRSENPVDLKELQSYALRFASSYSLGSSTWINFDVLVKESPFAAIANKVQFLKANKYSIETDGEFSYFLKISDYKTQDQVSPLGFVREQIKNIIINKRKVNLANELEDEVFSKARQGDSYDIYR
jgi:hypothetical protein